jgi:hypothetical protein
MTGELVISKGMKPGKCDGLARDNATKLIGLGPEFHFVTAPGGRLSK